MEIISRQEWGAEAPESPLTPWDPDDLQGIVVHHFAIPRAADSHAGCDNLMRSVQRAHKADEFIDIAYNHCFCPHGFAFEGRGFGFQTGAHTPLNQTHAAICYMGDSDQDGFPEKAQDAAGWLIRKWFRRGVGMQVLDHGAIAADPTACPGHAARNWVRSGAWKKDLPENRLVQFLLVDDGVVIDKSVRGPLSESAERWRFFRNSDAGDRAHTHMAQEGSRGAVTFVRKITVV